MSSVQEGRIPLEVFHIHFIRTHKKEQADSILDDLRQRAERAGDSVGNLLSEWMRCNYPQPGFRDDNWYLKEVSLDDCYFAHTDFRLLPVPKDQRFVDFLRDRRSEIECGSFPFSLEIRASWKPMPEPLAQERGPEKYYILDGQLRVIRHWYHDVPNVKVLIYRGQCDV